MKPTSNPKNTIYDQRYKSKEQYWDFKPSSMALKILELRPPSLKKSKVLEIGCGEGGTAIFLARNGFEVTAFDYSEVGLQKTLQAADAVGVKIKAIHADINQFEFDESFDIIFSSGTLQYLRPEKRKIFMEACQGNTNPSGLNVLHTFVQKPFIEKAPDAEDNESLWTSGELLTFYRDWKIENFIEKIKPCNSSGIPHQHAHNRIWATKVAPRCSIKNPT
jgi:tellurite methyltransferase